MGGSMSPILRWRHFVHRLSEASDLLLRMACVAGW